jgi:hypothetical protein
MYSVKDVAGRGGEERRGEEETTNRDVHRIILERQWEQGCICIYIEVERSEKAGVTTH